MKILLILTVILIASLDYLLIVGADERRYKMPTDIYHSEYTKSRNGKKEQVNYTGTHESRDGKDIDSETKTEVTHYKGDNDGC